MTKAPTHLREWADAFFTAHVGAHPEDGSSLGLREHAGRLSDPSPEATSAELTRLRTTLAEGAAFLERGATLDEDARLDLDAVMRAARHHTRWYERDADASNLELAVAPNGAVQHAMLHLEEAEHVDAVVRRAEAVPAFLAAHAENLRRGARDGRAPDRVVVEAFVQRVLPGAATSMQVLAAAVEARAARAGVELTARDRERLGRAGAAAHEAHLGFARFVASEVAPAARAHVVLGAEEVAFRLHETMGLEAPIDALVARARHSLVRAHEALVLAARAAGHAHVKTAADARDALFAVFAPKPASVEEAVALYERHLDKAARFVDERGIVPLPDALALALEPMPAGMGDGIALTNWPAPRLDARGKGHAMYAPDASAHPVVQAKNLAVHEGIPGHYLQSATWQQGTSSAVRFLGVIDDVAMSRSYFGTMLSVEGWAVHMEQTLLAEGFYDEGPERIFFAFCDAVRAMRVLLELGLHAQGMTDVEAVELVTSATLMPESWARTQVLRAKRIPLQSLTYLVGSTEIAALRAGPARDLDLLSFHRALLSFGPVPPSMLQRAFA